MPATSLYDYQLDAIGRMHNGCILCGGVGSGKSRTSLAYYYKEQGGDLQAENYIPMQNPRDLYIITTARKRMGRRARSFSAFYKSGYFGIRQSGRG